MILKLVIYDIPTTGLCSLGVYLTCNIDFFCYTTSFVTRNVLHNMFYIICYKGLVFFLYNVFYYIKMVI